MNEIYVLGFFKDGKFVKYVRKGSNDSITAYDTIESAKRGLAQSRTYKSEITKAQYKIINFKNGEVVVE